MDDWAEAAAMGQLPASVPHTAAEAKEQGWSALMLAATWGHAGWCAQLLTHQPQQQVQAVSKGGYTALELACEHDHVQCIKVLLANKAPLLPLFIEFGVAAKLSTILQDMAQTVLAPDLLHQAIVAEIQGLHAAPGPPTYV
jgi:ankyrin repeat protein